MKVSYTYTILRYMHDVVTGEFVNIGVIVCAPGIGYLGSRVTTSASRIRRFFGHVDSDYLRDLFRHIERSVEHMAKEMAAAPLLGNKEDALTCAERIIPRDDSSFQLSVVAGGIADDPSEALSRLFDRFVNRYGKNTTRSTRQDQEILPLFKRALEDQALLSHTQTKLIASPDYDHEFPLAWKNGIWNACDAVSFDLAESGDILEKANKWMGRATNLSESTERFRLILLVGEPRRPELEKLVATAERIIRKAPLDIVTVLEREAPRLAAMVAEGVAH